MWSGELKLLPVLLIIALFLFALVLDLRNRAQKGGRVKTKSNHKPTIEILTPKKLLKMKAWFVAQDLGVFLACFVLLLFVNPNMHLDDVPIFVFKVAVFPIAYVCMRHLQKLNRYDIWGLAGIIPLVALVILFTPPKRPLPPLYVPPEDLLPKE